MGSRERFVDLVTIINAFDIPDSVKMQALDDLHWMVPQYVPPKEFCRILNGIYQRKDDKRYPRGFADYARDTYLEFYLQHYR